MREGLEEDRHRVARRVLVHRGLPRASAPHDAEVRSPLEQGGQRADRYDKALVAQRLKLAEIGVALIAIYVILGVVTLYE